jgi:uncharacterized protein (DUF433 family)
MPKTADSPMLTRREAAEITGLSIGVLDKAVEQKIVTVHRRRNQSFLRSDDLAVVVLLQNTSLPLPITVKRQIKRWVHDTKPYQGAEGAELHISDALVVRWSREISETVRAAESYARLRNQWIEVNPDIKGGEPVIRGTRIGVRGIAQRMDEGDTIEVLTEDYPRVPTEALQTAYTYAMAHPRRGRPARPWRDADEALDRRGPPRRWLMLHIGTAWTPPATATEGCSAAPTPRSCGTASTRTGLLSPTTTATSAGYARRTLYTPASSFYRPLHGTHNNNCSASP